jgi:hypothetical protein
MYEYERNIIRHKYKVVAEVHIRVDNDVDKGLSTNNHLIITFPSLSTRPSWKIYNTKLLHLIWIYIIADRIGRTWDHPLLNKGNDGVNVGRGRGVEVVEVRRMAAGGPPRLKKYRRDESEVSCCLKYLIFGFNVIFWLLGLFILGVGVWAWSEKETLSNLSKLTRIALDPAFILVLIGSMTFVIG